ncbi:hypothetical protein Hanom_Chr05g00399621 [Helianthus anomalus]
MKDNKEWEIVTVSTGKGSAKWALPLLEDPAQLQGSKPPLQSYSGAAPFLEHAHVLGLELMPGQEPPKSKPSQLPFDHQKNNGSLFIF